MDITTRQLKIANNADSGLYQNLHDGIFSVIVEYNLPLRDQSIMLALENGIELTRFVAKDKRISSLAISDCLKVGESYSLLEVAKMLRKTSRKKEIIATINGHDMTLDKLKEQLNELLKINIRCFHLHTGHAIHDHERDKKDNPLSCPERYMDSTKMLYEMKQLLPDLFVGSGVNPYKYTLEDSHLQYYKMLKKINTGVDFLTTRVGWDMKKLHELQWYQSRRRMIEPVIARLMFLSPEDVSNIINDVYPGFTISRELAASFQREAEDSVNALKIQIRRLSLQAAGCRFLGYSGIQVSGLPDPITAKAVIDSIYETFGEFESYDQWLEAWNEHFEKIDLTPSPHDYYIFNNLLEKETLDYDKRKIKLNDQMLEGPSTSEQLKFKLAKGLSLEKRIGPISNILKSILCDHSEAGDIEKASLLSTSACPKGLEEGSCDNSKIDGTCEFGHQKCFYHKVLQLVDWQKNIEALERAYEDN